MKPLLLAALLLAPLPAAARPVLLELFTSQSCSSCPPADALLAELAQQPGLLALDLHVDYWNGIGWRDPYSSPQYTARQQAYAAQFGDSEVYTPALVVDGGQIVVGSDRDAVRAAIAAARARPAIPMRLRRDGDGLIAEADPGQGTATLWLAGTASSRTTQVRGGENGGRTLTEANIVLSLTPVGHWSGQALSAHLPRPPGDGATVFLQAPDGHILGAAALAGP
jgi:hypothetical protein